MRKTTRLDDLNSVEEGVAKAKTPEGKKHRKAILEAIYDQMKDPYLEAMRNALVDAIKRNDIIKMMKIKSLVEDYSRSSSFIKKQYKAVSKISSNEAELWVKKQLKSRRGVR